MDLIQELKDAIINGNEEEAVKIAKDIIENKIDVQQAITDGIIAGMKFVGKKYEQHEYFVPEIIISTDTFNAAFEIFKPHLKKDVSDYKATVIIGVVKGDIHEIGKNIVAQFLSLSGYNIIDLGRNVHSDDFIKAVEKHRANVVCLSTLMSPTLEEMNIIVKKLNAKGLRNQVKVMIGGAPTDYEFMSKIGADFCCKDANEAVEVLNKYFAFKK